jgi:hypothetical protein
LLEYLNPERLFFFLVTVDSIASSPSFICSIKKLNFKPLLL